MTILDVLAVLAAGLAAGVLTSTVGVASLVSFPVLVAVGLAPVVANTSNTIGMVPGGLSGSFGYRRELREEPSVTRVVLLASAVGAVAGAALLLALPGSVFEVVVPWLVLATSALVAVQPWVRARVRRLGDGSGPASAVPPGTRVLATLTGVYGGYFGAGSGVMMLAVLGLGTSLPFRILNAQKTFAVMVANIVAAVVFTVLAPVDWSAVALLASGSVVGGYVGSFVGRALPEVVLRTLVVLAGTVAAVLLWRG